LRTIHDCLLITLTEKHLSPIIPQLVARGNR
jgi:hypothetical protein